MPRPREAPLLYVGIVQQGASSNSTPTRIDLTETATSMTYEEDEKAADKLTLQINNFDLIEFDRPYWRKGNLVEVAWGYPGRMTPTRSALIQNVKGFQALTIEALGKGIAMHKEQKSRSFVGKTRSQVAAAIAAENGYGPSVQHIEETGVVYDSIEQVRETDASFLMRLAKREGFEFFVDFDGFHWHRRKLGQPAVREYEFYTDPTMGDIYSINVENDVTTKPAAITMVGRDLLEKKDIKVQASESDTKRIGLAPALEVVDPRTGASTLQAGTGQSLLLHTTEPNASSAKRVADGIYQNSILTTVELSVVAVGDPEQLAKTIVTMKGIRSLSGNYYVPNVKHTVDGSGYKMTMKMKRDGRTMLQPAGAPAKAKQNDTPAANDPNQLQPREVVDGRTGQTQIQYVPANGRQQGGDGGS